MKARESGKKHHGELVTKADHELGELLKASEAGVSDIFCVYEEIERIYVASTQHMAAAWDESEYATGTLPR